MGKDLFEFCFALAGVTGVLLVTALIRYGMQQTAKARAEWQRFADETGGSIEKGQMGAKKLIVPSGQYTLTFDTYSVSDGENSTTYMRILAPYSPGRLFYFRLQPRARLPQFMVKMTTKAVDRAMAKLPAEQRAAYALTDRGEEILFGDAELDMRYILRATDPALARQIFAEPAIRRLLAQQKPCFLSLQPPNMEKELGNTVPVLAFQMSGFLATSDALRNAYDLISSILTEMQKKGLATPAPTAFQADAPNPPLIR